MNLHLKSTPIPLFSASYIGILLFKWRWKSEKQLDLGTRNHFSFATWRADWMWKVLQDRTESLCLLSDPAGPGHFLWWESAGLLAVGFTKEPATLPGKRNQMSPGRSSHLRHFQSQRCCRERNSSGYCLNTYLLKNPFMFTRNSKAMLYMGSKMFSNGARTGFPHCIYLVPTHLKGPYLHPDKAASRAWTWPASFIQPSSDCTFHTGAGSLCGFNPLGTLQSSTSCPWHLS